jgi:hypothetical protein
VGTLRPFISTVQRRMHSGWLPSSACIQEPAGDITLFSGVEG